MKKEIESIKQEREIVVTLCDFHYPYHDKKAVDVALKFIRFLNPMIIVLHEVMDFYSLSKFDKDPKRKHDLQADLDGSRLVLWEIRNACPRARIIMLESNHDRRLRKYLRSKAEELDCLYCLKFKNLMGLDDYNVEYKKFFKFRGILFKHGNIVKQESGYTAKAEFQREGMSGASGHSHRASIYFKTLRGGNYTWMESGCLCDAKKADYIDGTANWTTALSLFSFKKGSNRYYPAVVPIISNSILWGRRTFYAD